MGNGQPCEHVSIWEFVDSRCPKCGKHSKVIESEILSAWIPGHGELSLRYEGVNREVARIPPGGDPGVRDAAVLAALEMGELPGTPSEVRAIEHAYRAGWNNALDASNAYIDKRLEALRAGPPNSEEPK